MQNYLRRSLFKINIWTQNLIYRMRPTARQKTIDDFHKLFYNAGIEGETWAAYKFLGYKIQKCPFDLMTYQDILWETKPDLIIETGTAYGGGALYLASLCELIGKGEIITVDIWDPGNRPSHRRITYLLGSSTSEDILKKIEKASRDKKKVMVILDSDHTQAHVQKELELYSPLVTRGCYLIVEDTNVNGNPVYREHGPGPKEAVDEFLKTANTQFSIDKSREGSYVTFNPGGYLLKK